ncbi:MAG TPA: TIGR04211 family SH3 domain-containing protein [Gammaproteobacteria bacterium]|nr:TIGR04211 family SH3 domain-containing protein [Gammaproteobacteria bacterium]
MLKRLASIAALCACAASASAETLYVTDSLRLALYESEDLSDKPLSNLVSGTPVQLLERSSSLARVRTPGGEEGWVKASFLVPDKPAKARVAELEAELAGLRSENAEYRGARANANESAEQLARSVAASKDSADAMHEAVGKLERENAAYAARLESFRGSLPMPWVAGALLVALIAGFAGGLWWLDALVRRRHSGFRVY